jgi:hypothetical protein
MNRKFPEQPSKKNIGFSVPLSRRGCGRIGTMFLYVLLTLLFFFDPFAQTSPSRAGEESYWQPVAADIQAGRYAEAYSKVDHLLEQYPGDGLLLRIKGICLLETEYFDAAVAVLEDALDADPASIASRYYLGQALAYRGSIREAIAVLEEMKRRAPDSEYVRLAEPALVELHNLVDSEAVLPDSRRWYLYGRVATEYDDNVPLRPNNSSDDSDKESWSLAYSLYGEYRFPDQKIDQGPVTLGFGYSLNGNEYERSLFHGYEMFSHGLSVFVSHAGNLLEKFYDLRLEGRYTFTRLGGEEYSRVGSLNSSFSWNWYDQASSTASLGWSRLIYEDDGEFPEYYSNDGDEYSLGLQNYLYLLENRLTLGLNYQYRIRNTKGCQNDLRSNDVTGSLTLALPWSLRLHTDLTYQQEDYPDYRDVSRLDNIWTWYTSLEYVFLRYLTLELGYTHATADSNLDFAQYRRNVFTIALSASY